LIIKPRIESPELLIFRILSSRTDLSEKAYQHYLSLEKGFIGEKKFDDWSNTFLEEWTFINDLLLEHRNSFFQLDSIGVTQNELYLFDVKNYEGDYVIKDDVWQTTTGLEIKNPLHQLQRCETLLRRFLQEHGFTMKIKPFLIFIHPHFTLYNAPLDPCIVLPTQIETFFKKLQSVIVNNGHKQKKLAEILISAHHPSYPNSLLPSYEYNELAKGSVCIKCQSLIEVRTAEQSKFVCPHCHYKESNQAVILRSFRELKLLFPDKKITSTVINDWCNGIIGIRTIQRILAKNFELKGHGRSAYYTD